MTDGVVLTLKDDKIGTKLSATRAMHYGKMTVEMQTAWSGGVVTAAVLMGDTTEEVDVSLSRLAACFMHMLNLLSAVHRRRSSSSDLI